MTLSIQLYTMLSMLGMGIYLGAALDTYHRFLKRNKRKRLITFCWDIVFWLVQGVVFFAVLLTVNKAELRIYVFLAILCGYATYQSLFRLLYLKILEIIIQIFVWTYLFLYNCVQTFLIKPIIWIISTLWAILLFLWRVILRIIIWLSRVIFKIASWFGRLAWRLLPKKWRNFLLKYAGILKHITKVTETIQQWWNRLRRR